MRREEVAGGRGRGETIIIDFGKYLAKPDLIKYLTRTAPIASDGAADIENAYGETPPPHVFKHIAQETTIRDVCHVFGPVLVYIQHLGSSTQSEYWNSQQEMAIRICANMC